jgi:hypothetical protein
VIGLFLLPVHYYTHVLLIFFSGIWATNIHDAVVSPAVLTSRPLLTHFVTWMMCAAVGGF